MYELDETYLKRLFIKALELKTEQTVCMDLKEHAVIAPKNPREVEANKKLKKKQIFVLTMRWIWFLKWNNLGNYKGL